MQPINMSFYFEGFFLHLLPVWLYFETFWLPHSAACIKGITFVVHPQAAMACREGACTRACMRVGSCRLGEAVIWHVSECVWANQTEGPL